MKTRILSEIVETLCDEKTKSITYTNWHLKFIPHNTKINICNEKLSVHFIMFDGGSRFILKHQLPQTIKYLQIIKDEYSMYDMLKYHTIDHNSFIHFAALFYGHRFTSPNNSNNYKLLFEYFNEEKFITINAHLDCDVNENFYIHNNYSGSDHNLNPPSCDKCYMKNMYTDNARCLGDKQIHKHYFKYLKDALTYYHSKNQPVFSEFILMDSHDHKFNSVPRVDKDLKSYIKYMHDSGILNKSIIILTSDHGLHYGNYYNSKVYCL